MELEKYLQVEQNYWYLNLRIIPNSKKAEIAWEYGEWIIKIKLIWIPEKQKVNKELIAFISKELNIAKSNIEIISWEKSRNKKIKINLRLT